MPAQITDRNDSGFTITVTVPYASNMLDGERHIQSALNDAGSLASAEILQQFDADGSPIKFADETFYSKGQVPKHYQTPYGRVTIPRHVYQTSRGGSTFCPLDHDARIVIGSTPLFAQMVSYKYAYGGASAVQQDLSVCLGRDVSRELIQDLADAVAAVIELKEETWGYALPKFDAPPRVIAVSLDAASVYMTGEGWRMAMVGTLAFYGADAERLHTIYLGAAPEYGKETFLGRLDRELTRAKTAFPNALTVGIADGAADNWTFLESRTDRQILDYWHLVEKLHKAADELFANGRLDRQGIDKSAWLGGWRDRLKTQVGAAALLGADIKRLGRAAGESVLEDADVKAMLTYLENQANRMGYAEAREEALPIGSGVTEAACKVIVKQRLCGSGMRWKKEGAATVMALRTLAYTTNRWDQFWAKVSRNGLPMAA